MKVFHRSLSDLSARSHTRLMFASTSTSCFATHGHNRDRNKKGWKGNLFWLDYVLLESSQWKLIQNKSKPVPVATVATVIEGVLIFFDSLFVYSLGEEVKDKAQCKTKSKTHVLESLGKRWNDKFWIWFGPSTLFWQNATWHFPHTMTKQCTTLHGVVLEERHSCFR